MRNHTDLDMIKFMFRSNARRKQIYGVHESGIKAFSPNGGQSYLSFVSVDSAKAQVRDNLEALKLMSTKKYKQHLAKMRKEAVKYYRTINK